MTYSASKMTSTPSLVTQRSPQIGSAFVESTVVEVVEEFHAAVALTARRMNALMIVIMKITPTLSQNALSSVMSGCEAVGGEAAVPNAARVIKGLTAGLPLPGAIASLTGGCLDRVRPRGFSRSEPRLPRTFAASASGGCPPSRRTGCRSAPLIERLAELLACARRRCGRAVPAGSKSLFGRF